MEREEFLKKLYNIFTNLSHNPKNDIYRVIGKEFGYFDLPKKRSLKDLVDFKVLYRGFREKVFLEELLFDGNTKNIFLGHGNFGKGIYSSQDRNVARSYSGIGNYNEDNVLKMYIKDFNLIKFEDLDLLSYYILNRIRNVDARKVSHEYFDSNIRLQEFAKFIYGLKNKELEIAKNILNYNKSAFAIILGYDIIDISEKRESPDFLILNRGKIHVVDVDYNRILGQSKRYKKVDPEKMPAASKSQRGE